MGPEGQAGLVSSGGTWESPLSGDDSCPRENVSCWGPGMRLCFAGPVRGLEGEGRPSLLSVLSRMLPWIAWEGRSGQVQGQRADIPSWLPPHWVIVSGWGLGRHLGLALSGARWSAVLLARALGMSSTRHVGVWVVLLLPGQ